MAGVKNDFSSVMEPTDIRSGESEPSCARELVSVIIPTRNRPDQLSRAIESVLDQSHKDLEIIVIDDGSTPPARIEQCDLRIRLIRNNVSRGAARARNTGIEVAEGRYICFLDDDDYYIPDKLSKQLEYLRRHPNVDMVFSNVMCDKGNGVQRPWLHDTYEYDFIKNLRRNRIHTDATLLRRHIVDRVNFAEVLSNFQDTEFFTRVSLHFTVGYLPEIVAVWHRDNRSDRLTLGHRAKKYESYRLFVRSFEEVIDEHAGLRNHHYRRLVYMALRLGDFSECRRLFAKFGVLNSIMLIIRFYVSTKRKFPRLTVVSRDSDSDQ